MSPIILVPSKSSIASYVGRESSQLRDAVRWIGQNANVILILCTFFVAQLGKQAIGVLLQYTSKTFHWSYAQVFPIIIQIINKLTAILKGILPRITLSWRELVTSHNVSPESL